MNRPELDPSHIMQIGMGFFGSRALLSAVELELFTYLGANKHTAEDIRKHLDLHPRAVPDFADALVALRVLERDGEGPKALYSNTPETAVFLDRNSPHYLGGILEMAGDRLYGFWGSLTEALRTGEPQNEIKQSGEPMFAKLYSVPDRLEQFMNAMAGVSAGNFRALAEKFDFSRYQTLCDAGGATGQLACMVAAAHPHMRCISADLPHVEPIAKRCIESVGLSDRVQTAVIDFFSQPLPKADVITMGMILHDWNLEKKKHLIKLAYDALPPGGAFIVVEALIDDARRENAFGLLMSLNMLIEFGDAFDYTGADFKAWCGEAGFSSFEIIPLAGPSSAAVAYKPG
ncbi:MAG: methyltransferase [Myxococcales bacterium SG8_38]|nr:MAG: methyltransferase [Myxococcales bacterium SG8_38]